MKISTNSFVGTFIILFLICGHLNSQVSDSARFYAALNATGTMNRTNVSSSYVLNNSLKLAAKKKLMSYSFINSWLYGKQNKRLTNNDYTSSFDVYVLKDVKRIYYWGLTYYKLQLFS